MISQSRHPTPDFVRCATVIDTMIAASVEARASMGRQGMLTRAIGHLFLALFECLRAFALSQAEKAQSGAPAADAQSGAHEPGGAEAAQAEAAKAGPEDGRPTGRRQSEDCRKSDAGCGSASEADENCHESGAPDDGAAGHDDLPVGELPGGELPGGDLPGGDLPGGDLQIGAVDGSDRETAAGTGRGVMGPPRRLSRRSASARRHRAIGLRNPDKAFQDVSAPCIRTRISLRYHNEQPLLRSISAARARSP